MSMGGWTAGDVLAAESLLEVYPMSFIPAIPGEMDMTSTRVRMYASVPLLLTSNGGRANAAKGPPAALPDE